MVVVQQSPVIPIHIFFIEQSCKRQAENSRSKQNDALRCRVAVVGVTDIRVAGSFPIPVYLERLLCVQQEVNWAVSVLTQISETM
jgi:hypothetical protein